ncbi:hypothetical protein N7G274_006365 [Stereocaulon virgatum]|uniref:Uncharacterized protein n=1 Tax=Stereocaulon virgatum TaxID=373712 RepID=A0ABR4A920_9LECA
MLWFRTLWRRPQAGLKGINHAISDFLLGFVSFSSPTRHFRTPTRSFHVHPLPFRNSLPCFPSVNVLSPPSPSSSPSPSHLHSHLLYPCPSPSPLPPLHPPHSPSPLPHSTAPSQSSLSETEVSFAVYSASIPQQSASFSPAQISPTPKKTFGWVPQEGINVEVET